MVWASGDRRDAIELCESVNMVPNNIYLDLWYTCTDGLPNNIYLDLWYTCTHGVTNH